MNIRDHCLRSRHYFNVVDLVRRQSPSKHPHGLSDVDFDKRFMKEKPVSLAVHAYPWLIHRLTYRRPNHENIHVRGYKEDVPTTTVFDLTVHNDLDRFYLVMEVIDSNWKWSCTQ